VGLCTIEAQLAIAVQPVTQVLRRKHKRPWRCIQEYARLFTVT
jgi:hypothetical protein